MSAEKRAAQIVFCKMSGSQAEGGFDGFISRWILAESQSSEISARTAQVRRRREASLGKREATRVPKALSAVEWAAFAFLIDAFEGVGGAQAALMGGGQLDEAEALGEVFLHPDGELWGGGGVGGDDFLKPGLGVGAIRGEEDAANVGGDLEAQLEARDVGDRKSVV